MMQLVKIRLALSTCVRRSERPSPLNQIDHQNNDCDYEQQMDQSPANVAKKAQKPENDENYKYGPQHKFIPVKVRFEIMCNPAARRSRTKSELVSREAKAKCILSYLFL